MSILGSFAASFIMLGISSLNYPGGEALFRLHEIAASRVATKGTVSVHMDVLACMTGVSRFQQDFPTLPISHYLTSILLTSSTTSSSPKGGSLPIRFRYDKTEEPSTLLDPLFWTQFDYVLAEHPETVIGRWNIVDTIYGYSGIEFLRPGAISRSGIDNRHEAGNVWEEMGGQADMSSNRPENGMAENGKGVTVLKVFYSEVDRLGLYGAVREGTRRWITKGWWIGPKMEAKIRIMKRALEL
jgi:alpha-1,6-mannosyltransferase